MNGTPFSRTCKMKIEVIVRDKNEHTLKITWPEPEKRHVSLYYHGINFDLRPKITSQNMELSYLLYSLIATTISSGKNSLCLVSRHFQSIIWNHQIWSIVRTLRTPLLMDESKHPISCILDTYHWCTTRIGLVRRVRKAWLIKILKRKRKSNHKSEKRLTRKKRSQRKNNAPSVGVFINKHDILLI